MPPGDETPDDEDEDEDGVEYVCGADTDTTDEPCQNTVDGPDERCFIHGADGPPDGHGSNHPNHRQGGNPNADANLPDNNKPDMDHGLYAVRDDPAGTLRWLNDNDPTGYEWVIRKWRSYLAETGHGPTSAAADDILHAALMLYAVRLGRHEQVTRGFTRQRPLTDDNGDVILDQNGDPVTVEDEWPGNLPVNRVAREARKILKDRGVSDDPERDKAAAMAGWGDAARRVAAKYDSTVTVDVDGGEV